MNCFLSSCMLLILSLILLLFLIPLEVISSENPEGPCLELRSSFTRSLHFTGNGMKYWYQEPNGFMSLTGIPYENLGCKSCHVKSCDTCHAMEKKGRVIFSSSKAKKIQTCFQCHTREKLTFKKDKAKGKLDVHRKAGMVCADCHNQYEIHGDGKRHLSMRDSGVPRTNCRDCHTETESGKIQYNGDLLSHRIHGNKLDCAACHVSGSMTCYNCHFDSVLKSGHKKGNFVPIKSWTLLINYNGQVTSGSVMTIVYQDKKFVAYVPYFSHSVSSKGRTCQDCHGNKAVTTIEKKGKIDVVGYKDGQITSHEGVVPVVPEKLEWTFFDKTKKGWRPIKSKSKVNTQFAVYGKPLNQQQYQMLKQKMSPDMFQSK